MLKLPKLIAVSGLRNSGKDTVADMLQYLLNTPKIFHNYVCFKHIKWLMNLGTFKKFSFATPLKEILAIILGVDVKKFEDRYFKEHTYVNLNDLEICDILKTPYLSDNEFNRYSKNLDPFFTRQHQLTIRQLMQFVGTDVLRTFLSDELWINSTLRKPGNKIISDLRFKVEFNAVKKYDGIIIYIRRPIAKAGNHASEKEVVDLYENNSFDYVIENTESLKELFIKTKNIVEQIW